MPQLHAVGAGVDVPVGHLADLLLDPAHARDGVSLLGGEPFAQPDGLLALVAALRDRACGHIVAYSGYTYERLCAMAVHQPAITGVLDGIDLLIDGPYVAARSASAGAWTGSGNQRVLDARASQALGRAVRWRE